MLPEKNSENLKLCLLYGIVKNRTADLQMEFEEKLFKFGVIVSGFLDLWRRVFIASKIWKFLAGNIS